MLDYIRRKGEPPRTKEQMRQDMDIFLRECRKEYKKAGIEFKYIHVMEIGDKGAEAPPLSYKPDRYKDIAAVLV